MNNAKKWIAAAAALGLLSSGAAFANNTPPEDNQPDVPAQEPLVAELSPVVNGAKISGVESATIDGILMVPVRQTAEALGYTVEWNEEDSSVFLIKGAQTITFAIGQDAYAFSRRAPEPLGCAPVLVNDTTTYVPIALFTDLIGAYYTTGEDGTLTIVNPSIVEVSEVNEDGSLSVVDSYLGEVIVDIVENTVITKDSAPATAEDIKPGMILAVEYSDAMTASLPPQTTAVKINIENSVKIEDEDPNGDQLQAVAFSGVIKEITEDNGYTMVLIDNDSDVNDEVLLVVSDETIITKGLDKRIYKADDLKEGMKISGTHRPAMTMSIPPQTAALTISMEAGAGEEEDAPAEALSLEGTIVEIDEAGHVVVAASDDGEKSSQIALTITEDTVITKEGEPFEAEKLKADMKVSVKHSPVMTKSLPPQTEAFEITVGE